MKPFCGGVGGPYISKDDNVLGSVLGVPLVRETSMSHDFPYIAPRSDPCVCGFLRDPQ